MPVYLDLATRLDRASAEKAAKDVTEKFVDAAKEINGTVGGILSKMFDGIDGGGAHATLKSLQDEYAKLAKSAGDAERAQVSSAGNVEVAIKRLAEVHAKYGAATSQTAAAENRLVNAWALSERAATDAAAAADAAAASHVRLGGAAEGMNTSMLLAAGGVAAVGLAAVEGTRKLFEMGEQWADISDRITATTGKIGADAEAMTDQITDIANKTAAPIESIAQVYAQLTRLKELQGSTLNDLTKQVSDFNQMSGETLNIGAFTRTMQEFHVPASQMGADLDILHGAAQDGQVPLNELIQTMKTAGPAADIAGLSFGQMANVLAALDESGVNVDTSLKAIKMGLGNIAIDSKALQKQIKFGPDENELQRLKDVIQKIQQLRQAGDSIGAIDLGKTVFGRSWTDIGQAILDNKLNVDTLNTSISQLGPGIEPQREATKHFGDDWQVVKNKIADALKPLSEDVFKTADEGLKRFMDDMDHGATISKSLADGLGNWGNAALTLINPAIALASELQHLLSDEDLSHTDLGAGHTGASGRAHRSGGDGIVAAPSPNNPTGGGEPAVPTTPNINVTKPYHPLDLNPADKPPGAETYDEWINSQKAVQSALDHQADTGERLAAAQQRQKDLLDSGKATQEQLNSVAAEIATAQREGLQAEQDLTIAKQKYVEDANKTAKGKKSNNPFDSYDPFTEATKGGQGLIPQLAGLATAFVANLALGNPFGKALAAKRGEDPSNPMYVSDVSATDGASAPGDTGGGLPGILRRLIAPSGQPTAAAPSGGRSPAGSIPSTIPGQPGQVGTPSTGYTSDAALLANVPPGRYSQAPDRDLLKGLSDCSSSIGNLVDIMQGKDENSGGLMSTGNAADWLTKHGFIPNTTGANVPGAFNVGYNGEHMQATLPGGTNFNYGSNAAAQARGISGGGAFDPTGGGTGAFTQHYYLPVGGPDINPGLTPQSPFSGPAPAPGGPGPGWVAPTTQAAPAPALPPPSPPPPPARGSAPLPGILGSLFGPQPSDSPAFPMPGVQGYASGGSIPASDTVPAMLTPKEFVVKKDAAEKHRPELEAMNAGQDPHKPTPDRVSPTAPGAPSSSRQPLGSVTPPPPGPRIGQGTGSGFGIGGGIIGMAETAAIMAAMGAAGMAEGGMVPGGVGASAGAPVQDAAPPPGGGGGKSGGGGGGGGDPMTAVLNRTVGYIGQLGAIGVQGLMSSLIPGASQKGGIMDGGIVSKLVGGFAGAHPSAPNTAGNTAVPLAPPGGTGPGESGGTTNHIGMQAGVHVGTMNVASPDDGKKVADQLAFQSYAGYGSR